MQPKRYYVLSSFRVTRMISVAMLSIVAVIREGRWNQAVGRNEQICG